MSDIKTIIENAFENRAEITPRSVDTIVKEAVTEAIQMLDKGEARVAEKQNGDWIVNEWLKKAVLLSFRVHENEVIDAGYTNFFDKLPQRDQDLVTGFAAGCLFGLAFGALLATAGPAFAQDITQVDPDQMGRVVARLVDAQTGAPVTQALVSLRNLDRRTISDSTGTAMFREMSTARPKYSPASPP